MSDKNVAVAKLICLDLGWHLEYRTHEEQYGNFMLVIPALRYENQAAAGHHHQDGLSQNNNNKLNNFLDKDLTMLSGNHPRNSFNQDLTSEKKLYYGLGGAPMLPDTLGSRARGGRNSRTEATGSPKVTH